jgi:16S rRNA U1498 N3-methylase RsmE
LVISGDPKDAEPTRVLIAKITKLEKLQHNRLEAKNQCGSKLVEQIYVESTKNTKKKIQFGNYVL